MGPPPLALTVKNEEEEENEEKEDKEEEELETAVEKKFTPTRMSLLFFGWLVG